MAFDKRIKLMLLSGNLWWFAEGMFGPLFAVFAERVGGGILEVSWAWATYLIVSGLLYILVGKFTDAKDVKELTMFFGYIVNTIFTFGFLFVSEPWHLFIVQAGLGIGAALATPTWYALYARYEDHDHDGFEWGLAGGLAQINTAFAILIGGYIVQVISFDALFITMGCIQILATICQAYALGKKKSFETKKVKKINKIRRKRK